MAKEETSENITLTTLDGIRFGLGFFIVNMTGLAAIGVVAYLIIIAGRSFGLAF
jgi:hypothetical protein